MCQLSVSSLLVNPQFLIHSLYVEKARMKAPMINVSKFTAEADELGKLLSIAEAAASEEDNVARFNLGEKMGLRLNQDSAL